MSSKKKQAELREKKDWETIDKAVVSSGTFLDKYSKQILIAIGAFVIAACGYIGYKQLYQAPQNEEAKNASARGQDYIAQRQDSIALFGDGNGYIGFAAIADKYSSTAAGNLAKAYAGICYANLGQYDKAITLLKDYSGNDDVFSHVVQGTIGTCLDNQGKADEAISHYEKAAKGSDSNEHSPIFYKKAALLHLNKGNYDKVIEIFTTVKEKYMNSQIARAEADKYIDLANSLKEDGK